MRFVVAVDTQADFMEHDGALAVDGADALIGPMRAWLAALQPAETAGVLFTFDTHEPDRFAGSEEAKLFPLHCARGTAGWGNVLDPATLHPAIARYRLEKGVFDMWAEPGLTIEAADGSTVDRDRFFAGLKAAGITEMIVIGVAADYCVRWALAGLVERGFHCTVPSWLTRGIERQIDAVARDEFGDGVVVA